MTEYQPARRIFIGDVHGHYQGLIALLSLLNLAEDDQLYFVGDLIDRGPESAQVVEFVKQSDYPCVLGNHECMMLGAFQANQAEPWAMQAWLSCGGRATLASYADCDYLPEHLTWMKTLPNYLDLGDIWLVHAGVAPNLTVEEQTEQEFCWIRSDFHTAVEPYFPDKLIIAGHTITFTFPGIKPGQLVQGPGWIDIDTGAYHTRSGWLTALDMQTQTVYQVNVDDNLTRIRPLSEAVTPIQPRLIKV